MLRLIIAGMLISTAAAAQSTGTASLPPPKVTPLMSNDLQEGPNDVHVVGRNASTTQPAKFVVVLVKDKGAPALVPAK